MEANMTDFQTVLRTSDLAPGEMKVLALVGAEVVIANVSGHFFAFSNVCPHEEGPLGEGDLEGDIVTCPWHSSRFNVRSGDVVDGVTDDAVRTYELRVEGDQVQVRMPDDSA
jgi:nitrite reductase/ring-hydroxylating ferredoxin subunit